MAGFSINLAGIEFRLSQSPNSVYYTHSYRQIECASLFLDVGRCKIHDDPMVRKFEIRVLDCRQNPFAALLDRVVRKSDDGKIEKPTLDMYLDLY